jgi:hypothetical protein
MGNEKMKLTEMSAVVHGALKGLKMGETGTITCTKAFTMDEVREYITAYAFHKNKWFQVKADSVSNTLYCERTERPNWDVPDEDPEEEETEEP